MKKYEVIEKLHTLPGNPEVLISNWAKNLQDGEGSGMYPFDITLEPNANHDEDPEKYEPNFISLSFDDGDRNEDGNLIEVEEIRLEALQVEASLKEQIEGYREALKQIEQFSDVGSAELAISQIKAIADNALNGDTNFTPANHLLKQNILERIKQINKALEQSPNGRGADNLKNLKMILDMALEESGIPNPAIKLWIPIADSQPKSNELVRAKSNSCIGNAIFINGAFYHRFIDAGDASNFVDFPFKNVIEWMPIEF